MSKDNDLDLIVINPVVKSVKSCNNNNNLYNLFFNIFGTVSIKESIFLFIIYIIISSNIFNKYVLNEDISEDNLKDEFYGNVQTIRKGIFLVVIFVLFQILININIL
jgi:hypothetical protein